MKREMTETDLADIVWEIKRQCRICRQKCIPNKNAFSIDVRYKQNELCVDLAFDENYSMTIMYYRDTDNEAVDKLYNGTADYLELALGLYENGLVTSE